MEAKISVKSEDEDEDGHFFNGATVIEKKK
jgi:hypothetical protein